MAPMRKASITTDSGLITFSRYGGKFVWSMIEAGTFDLFTQLNAMNIWPINYDPNALLINTSIYWQKRV